MFYCLAINKNFIAIKFKIKRLLTHSPFNNASYFIFLTVYFFIQTQTVPPLCQQKGSMMIPRAQESGIQ